MRKTLAIVAATVLLSLTGVESASALVVSQTRVVSNGFTTCRVFSPDSDWPLSSSLAVRACVPFQLGPTGLGCGGLGLGLGGGLGGGIIGAGF